LRRKALFLLLLLPLLLVPSWGQVGVVGADAVRNNSLKQFVVETDAQTVTEIFTFNSVALRSYALTPEYIPTVARNRSELFLFGHTASVRASLKKTAVIANTHPLRKPFLLHQQTLVLQPLSYPGDLVGDQMAPILEDVQSMNITATSAQILWTTNEYSDSLVRMGTKPGNWSLQEMSALLDLNHSINITGLLPGTVYYYQAMSTDRDDNRGESAVLEITTAAG